MRFEITDKGRTLFLLPDEKKCRKCGSKDTMANRWYYYDEPLSKGLYCKFCASDATVGYVRDESNGKLCQFWQIDSFRYGGEEE